MLGKLLLALLLLIAPSSYASDISRSHVFVDGSVLTAAQLNTGFDEIVNEVNDLDGDNLSSSIAITSSGAMAFSGNFSATGSALRLGNGSGDALSIDAASGINYDEAMTWTFTGAQTVSGTWANLGSITTADINGGTIDGVTIGASVAPTVTNIDINGGTIDGTSIGASSASTGSFTTLFTSSNTGIGTSTATGGRLMVQGGNVGIGTVNANEKLTVAGKIYTTSGGVQFPDNSIQTSAALTTQVFTYPGGTFTAPVGVTKIYVTLVGGGGGAGGAGGGGTGGSDGGATSFDTVLSANGGKGGGDQNGNPGGSCVGGTAPSLNGTTSTAGSFGLRIAGGNGAQLGAGGGSFAGAGGAIGAGTGGIGGGGGGTAGVGGSGGGGGGASLIMFPYTVVPGSNYTVTIGAGGASGGGGGAAGSNGIAIVHY